ncbi:hypothetical protein [Roseomonas sp. BN140053]|uniref:hypothetical protein n=1 Tax=Roseomonas sp. BN140053 TaxID=3391898 RepID=UPI0039EC6786
MVGKSGNPPPPSIAPSFNSIAETELRRRFTTEAAFKEALTALSREQKLIAEAKSHLDRTIEKQRDKPRFILNIPFITTAGRVPALTRRNSVPKPAQAIYQRRVEKIVTAREAVLLDIEKRQRAEKVKATFSEAARTGRDEQSRVTYRFHDAALDRPGLRPGAAKEAFRKGVERARPTAEHLEGMEASEAAALSTAPTAPQPTQEFSAAVNASEWTPGRLQALAEIREKRAAEREAYTRDEPGQGREL